MADTRDYYEILGVPRDADADAIKSAYRRLALRHHPDRSKAPDAAERFREATEAYAVLSDPEKRTQFDRYGRVPAAGEGPGGGFGRVDVGDLGDIFEEFFGRRDPFGGGGSPFGSGSPFGGGGRGGPGGPSPGPRRGEDLRAEVRVPLRDTILGGSAAVRLSSGEAIDVRIPAGITEGRTLRIRGRGGPGRSGGPRGDLLVRVIVDPHPWYRREGLDVVMEVPITVVEAALGAVAAIPLPDGRRADVRIPAGTPSGRRIRLKSQGVDAAEGRGDFLCEVRIVAPEAGELDAEARAALARIGAGLTNPRRGGAWADTEEAARPAGGPGGGPRSNDTSKEPPAC